MNKVVLVAMVFAVLCVGGSAYGQSILEDNCMDCTERTGLDGKKEASCCLADSNNECFGGYQVVDYNVGYGCQTRPVRDNSPEYSGTASDGTECASTLVDYGCPSGQ